MHRARRNGHAAADIMGAWELQVILLVEGDSLVEAEEMEEGEGVVGEMAEEVAEEVVVGAKG